MKEVNRHIIETNSNWYKIPSPIRLISLNLLEIPLKLSSNFAISSLTDGSIGRWLLDELSELAELSDASASSLESSS